MRTSQAGIDKIKKYEALVLHIYKDAAGLNTIGYGHLLTSTENSLVTYIGGITEATAVALLAEDLLPAETAVNKLVTVVLTQDQFDSLVSFTFNCGAGALASSSLLKAINSKASSQEITADFIKWDKIHVNGQVVESAGLRMRRLDEAKAF